MSFRYNEKRLERRRPNGWNIELLKVWAKTEPEEDAYFQVVEATTGDTDKMEFETEAEARKYFEERCAELSDIPNMEAQYQYDMAHGTVNGEDAMREAWGE